MMVPFLSFHSKNVKKKKQRQKKDNMVIFQDQILLSHLGKSDIPSSFAYHFLTAGVMLLLFEETS